jgi:hypothetical protein
MPMLRLCCPYAMVTIKVARTGCPDDDLTNRDGKDSQFIELPEHAKLRGAGS